MAFDRMDSNVANALMRGLRALDPSIDKPSMKDTPKGMVYTFKPDTKLTLDAIVKSIAAIDEPNSAVHGKDTVIFTIDTKFGVQYEEEFVVVYNESEPDAKLFQVRHNL